MKDYPGKVRVVYKHYVVHPDRATTPALAACAAQQQGKFSEMKHLIWEKGFKENALDEAKMIALATEAKLDLDKFKADMAGDACKQLVSKDQAEQAKFGVNGRPGFFINGRFLGGAQPLPNFKRIVDEELKKAEEKIAAGTKPEDYYQKYVVEAGLKEFVPPPDEE